MRVMQVDVAYGASSTGKIVQDLRDGLIERGHEVVALYGRGESVTTPGVVKIASRPEVLFHAGMTRFTGWTGIYSPFATRKLKHAVDEFKPDIVHLHELHGYFVNIEETLDFLRLRSIPIVWTFHCEFMYTGKCGYANDCERWTTGCHKCPQLHEYPASFLFDQTQKMYERKRAALRRLSQLRLVTPSRWLADRVGRSFLAQQQIDVVYNGVDDKSTFYPRERAAARARFGIKTRNVVLSVAPDLMTQRKGGHWVLELARRMIDQDVTFVMIGVESGVPSDASNVIAFPRTRDQHFLADAYSASDVFLLTSQKETFSMVAAESLSCGTPLVGFDCGAPLEVAPNGYGHWTEYGNIHELQRVLVGVLDKSIPINTREQCRTFGVNRYSKGVMVTRYEGIYTELLDERS